MGAATLSAMFEGRTRMWADRADKNREARAATAVLQRGASPQGVPVRGAQPQSPQPLGVEPPARERVAITPERTAMLAEQKALAALAARCVAGDNAAWDELARTQHRRIYGICYRFTGSASEAEDLTQDVFIKVFRNLESFDASKGGFNTWLTTLTRNMLVDNYRRQRMDRVTDSLDEPLGGEDEGNGSTKLDRLTDPGRNQEQQVSGMQLRAQIQDALKQVSPELREAVILRDLEDMDYKDIAEVLGVPTGTVKSRISRGRSELAKLLKRIEGQVM
jgi:RNA polymerase sigma-70 factor (ECF subfamily)